MLTDPYTKATEIWFLLHRIEQLIINDPTYAHVLRDVANCLDRVETIQHDIEASGN
jgi:hypothetical protein